MQSMNDDLVGPLAGIGYLAIGVAIAVAVAAINGALGLSVWWIVSLVVGR